MLSGGACTSFAHLFFYATSRGDASGPAAPTCAERLRTSGLRARVLENALALDLRCSKTLCRFATHPVLSCYAVSYVSLARCVLFEKGVLRFCILSPHAIISLRSSSAIVVGFFGSPRRVRRTFHRRQSFAVARRRAAVARRCRASVRSALSKAMSVSSCFTHHSLLRARSFSSSSRNLVVCRSSSAPPHAFGRYRM